MKKSSQSILKGINYRLGMLEEALDILMPKFSEVPSVIFDYQARIDELTTLRDWANGKYDKEEKKRKAAQKKRKTVDKKRATR